MRVGFIGTGNIGGPIALRLLAAGHELSVWNRTEERTKPLIHEGAIAAATPAEAELGAEAVVTMLLDDQAYEEVFFGVHRLIDALSPGTLHLLCGSISVGLGERFVVEHARRDIDLVMATLAGTSDDARQGCLRVAVRGSETAVDSARPLLEAFSRFS